MVGGRGVNPYDQPGPKIYSQGGRETSRTNLFLLWVFQRPLSPSFVLVKGATVATRHTAFTIIINMARQRSDVLEAFFLTASSTLQSITGDICLLLHFHKLQEQFITTAQG